MNTTTTRTDTHRPSQMDPADYQDVGYLDVGGYDDQGDQWIEPAHAAKDFAPHAQAQWDQGYTRCGHCGQNARYFEVFLHTPSDRLLPVGMTCAGKLGLSTKHELEMRKQAERRKLARVRGHWLAGNPRAQQVVDAAVAHYVEVREAYAEDGLAEDHGLVHTDNFLYDLAVKFERYASLSDKQVEAGWWAAERYRQNTVRRDQWAQEREADNANRKPCPTGRQQVEGEVLKTKWYDNDFGGKLAMTVKTDDGWLVWGTVPSSIDPAKGDRVRFTATLEPSPDDEYFGFYKRPAKAEVVQPAAEPEPAPEPAKPAPVRTMYWLQVGGKVHARVASEEAAEQEASKLLAGLDDLQARIVVAQLEVTPVEVAA